MIRRLSECKMLATYLQSARMPKIGSAHDLLNKHYIDIFSHDLILKEMHVYLFVESMDPW